MQLTTYSLVSYHPSIHSEGKFKSAYIQAMEQFPGHLIKEIDVIHFSSRGQ